MIFFPFLVHFANFQRFATHKTFPYLIYDAIQLRKSSLGHHLLVKRQDWESTLSDIQFLTADGLRQAATAFENGQTIQNPAIFRLLRKVSAIGNVVPQSFAQKRMMRSHMTGIQVREGAAIWWLTINPSDLKNPIILRLAGIEFGSDALPQSTATILKTVATSNPVAVAQFFHVTCCAIFDGLLRSHSTEMGVLGQISNHYGVVESNGRGMLHLHALLWAEGNLGFTKIRDRVLNDNDFAKRMINFLESVIMQSVQSVQHDTNLPLRVDTFSKIDDSDDSFHSKLTADSNAVASKVQIHSSSHSSTCFKYGRKNSCRFNMPRKLVPTSYVDKYGVIHIARHNEWVVPWNPAITTCLRSNHDISSVPTVSKSLALLYYLTNYSTKDDISPQQILLKAALLKDCAEIAKNSPEQDVGNNDTVTNFLLRNFNMLSQDREVSGVQIASSLLQLPSYYTAHDNFVGVYLPSLRQHVRDAITSFQFRPDDDVNNEQCLLGEGTDSRPVSRFDDYKWRGDDLSLCFYEYSIIARTTPSS